MLIILLNLKDIVEKYYQIYKEELKNNILSY